MPGPPSVTNTFLQGTGQNWCQLFEKRRLFWIQGPSSTPLPHPAGRSPSQVCLNHPRLMFVKAGAGVYISVKLLKKCPEQFPRHDQQSQPNREVEQGTPTSLPWIRRGGTNICCVLFYLRNSLSHKGRTDPRPNCHELGNVNEMLARQGNTLPVCKGRL